MVASLVVVIVILGCPALLYFKGTFVKAFAAIIIAIVSGMAAFGFFEAGANILISRGESGFLLTLAPWAQTLCFILIFVVVFALLQTGAAYLLKKPVDLGFLPECIGRIACGIVLGFIVSGFLLTALAMGPLSLDYPYQRFDPSSLKPDDPKGALLGADGFATGLFSMVSKGSFSGKRSFATIHPNYLDQLFFNRLINTETTSIISNKFPAITVSRKVAVWPAPAAIVEKADGLIGDLRSGAGKLKDAQGKSVPLPVSTKGSYDVTIVRVGISKRAFSQDPRINGGTFTPAQLRLICKRKGSGQEDRFAGEAVTVYPIGHLRTASQIQIAGEIKLDSQKISGSEQLIDFVFCVPSGHEPVMVQYKLNSIVEIAPGAIVTDPASPKIPEEPATFNASSGGSRSRSNNRSNRSSDSPREQPQTQTNPERRRGLSDTSRSIVGTDFDEE